MKRNRYKWDPELLDWVPAKITWHHGMTRVGIGGALVLLVATGIFVAFDLVSSSPEELALMEENRYLQAEVLAAETRITHFEERLDELELRDQEIYRVMLQVDDIPGAVREVGVGGSESYEEYNRFSTSTASILSRVDGQLDRLERRVNLQSTSTQELMALAKTFEERIEEIPSIMPSTGHLTSSFGMRQHPIIKTRRHHPGVDITTPTGTPVHATAFGVIEEVIHSRYGYGIHILISHPTAGYKTLYGHLSAVMANIRPGQRVKRGQVIARSGNTGLSEAPHVHYEVQDAKGRALNPRPFLALQLSASEYRAILNKAAQE